MSLDVSPDGQTIVFDLLGDLYTLPITGGKATKITFGMALNRQPRYSPDGGQLVFVSDRSGSENLWIADRNGRHARQLSDLHGYDGDGAVTSPAWSSDARTIIASQRLGASRPGGASAGQNAQWLLAAYDVASRRLRWVSDTVADSGGSLLGPTFDSHDSVIYAAADAPGPMLWAHANWRIVRIDAKTGRVDPEMGANVGRAGLRPAISPKRRYLVYVSNSGTHMGLRLRDLQTDREQWLVREMLDDPPLAMGEARDLAPGYAFTPDAKALIVAYGGKIHRIDLARRRTSLIPFKADVQRVLGPLTVYQFSIPDTAVDTRSVMQPALSPDGHWVAFSVLDRIWTMKLPFAGRAAGQPRRLTADSIGEFYPSWSPDGRWVAYSTWKDGEGGAVRRASVTLDANTPPSLSQRLTLDTALYFHTAVAPDGNRVVAVRAPLPPERLLTDKHHYGSTDALEPVLVWIPAGGGRPRTVASLISVHSPVLRYPVDQVYFTDDSTRVFVGLRSWHWGGSGGQAAVVVLGRERSGGEIGGDLNDVNGVLAPDRRRALIVRKYTLFELSLPQGSAREARAPDTLNLESAQVKPFNMSAGAAHRWGRALGPWVSWSRDGCRVLFSQGGALLVGDVRSDGWTTFMPVNVPLEIPVDIPRGTVVLRGARLITMRGNEVIEQGDVVVRGNRIVAVGRSRGAVIPKDARVVDVTGTTILPGYVDVHVHPTFPKGVHGGQCWQCLAALAYGVTTARDPQANLDNDVFTYQERERAGDLLGPRVFSTGIPYHGTDPPIRSLPDARDAVRPLREYFGSETFKIYYDQSTDRRARQLLAMATAEAGLDATAHTNGVELELASIIDGLSGIEHPPDIRIYDDVVTLIARSGTTHTQTYGGIIFGSMAYMVRRYGAPWEWAKMRLFVPPSLRAYTCVNCTAAGPMELDNLLPLVSGAARIVAKGGRVGIGSHGNIPALGYHYEMWIHALGGMSNREILRSATIVGATAIGHAKDLGSLEVGKLADFQVLETNPLVDIRRTTDIRYVMKNGRLYRAQDLTEIWPRHRSLSHAYLWEGGCALTQRPRCDAPTGGRHDRRTATVHGSPGLNAQRQPRDGLGRLSEKHTR